jgi:hypothetical protein
MGARTRPAGLQTATDTYTNGPKTIVVIGVTHLASTEFWDGLNWTLTELEGTGYQVQYEAVKCDIPNPPPEPMPMREMADALGLTYQASPEGMTRPPAHWVNADMPLSRFLADADPAQLQAAYDDDGAKGREIIKLLREEPIARTLARWLLVRALPVAERLINATPYGVPRTTIIDARNRIAAEHALAHPGNVVTVWGAGHLKGIGKHLRAAGYVRTTRKWAVTIPAKPTTRHRKDRT